METQLVSLRTFKYGADLPDPRCSLSVVLSQSQLHVEEGHASDHHEEEVRHQESAFEDKNAMKVVNDNYTSLLPHVPKLAEAAAIQVQNSPPEMFLTGPF